MTNKFKVGDIVVGNKKANDRYLITTEGSILKVTKVYPDGTFEGEMISNPPFNYSVGNKFGIGDFGLDPEYFDLVTEGDKIVITTDGVTTTAKMYCGKTVIKKAEAKCAPGDKFDFEFGARLAMDRLVEDTKSGGMTVNDIVDSMTKKQKETMYYLIGKAIEDTGKTKSVVKKELTDIFGFKQFKYLESMSVEKKTPKVLSIEDFDWVDFKKGKCAIMVHTKTAYDEMLRRIKRRFCPSTPLDISSYYCGHSGYLHYGRDEKLRFTANDPDVDYIEASKFFKKRINMSDDDWKAFDSSDMTLRVTEDVEDDVLLTLKCLGYIWRSGGDMTSWTPDLDADEYYLTKDVSDGRIGFTLVEGFDILSLPPHHVSSIKIVKKV